MLTALTDNARKGYLKKESQTLNACYFDRVSIDEKISPSTAS
jgi:hypothetical protein